MQTTILLDRLAVAIVVHDSWQWGKVRCCANGVPIYIMDLYPIFASPSPTKQDGMRRIFDA